MTTNQPLENFNTDLRLIKSLSSHKCNAEWSRPPTVQKLVNLIKMRNKLNEPDRPQQVELGRQWLIKKGINLQPLISRIEHIKKQNLTTQTQQPISHHYYHVDLNQDTIPEYIEKAKEYSNINIMQYVMKKNNRRQDFISKIITNILEGGPKTSISYRKQCLEQQRNQYIAAVKDVVNRESEANCISKQLLKSFAASASQLSDRSLWEILSVQLQTFNLKQSLSTNISKMFITSLKLIQNDFERKLHGKDTNLYLTQNYLSKIQGRWTLENGGFWAKVWLFYSAGLQQDVINLLSSDKRDLRSLIQLYKASEEAIKNGKPLKVHFSTQYDIDDVFYEQFVFNISGQSRYSCTLMADPLSFELVLIVVSTLGIFYQNEKQKFQQIRAGIVRHYNDYTYDPQIIKNMLYLLDYKSVATLGCNSLMSKQDYLHYLIVLTGFPGLLNEPKLQNILTQQLSQFILELIISKRPQYIYYIVLLPDNRIVEEVSSIILTSGSIDSFNWSGLRPLINEQLYEKLVIQTITKFRRREGAQLKAANKFVQLLYNYQLALSCLLKLVINNYLNHQKYQNHELLQAEKLGLSWSRQSQSTVYEQVFDFAVSVRSLLSLIIKRNEHNLKQFISTSQFVAMQFEKDHPRNIRFIEVLSQHNGLQLYYYFLRLVVKGAQIYANRTGDHQKLSSLKEMADKKIKRIQQISGIKKELESPHLIELREQIKGELQTK